MNKGFPLTEFVLETVLRDGLGYLRANPTKMDYLFGRFLESHFLNQYGSAKITQIKTWVLANQVKLVHAFTLQPTFMPCISIQMLGSEEAPNLQHLGNIHPLKIDEKDREVIVASVEVTAYDSTTGKVTVSDEADLSVICPGYIFVDTAGDDFIIKSGISNVLGNKFFTIASGSEPDITSAGSIVDPIDFTATNVEMVRLAENIRVGIHVKDDGHLAKFLYYLVFYILKSRQKSLITRGIHLDYGTVSMFDREDTYEGQHIFSRFIDLRCISEFNFEIDEVAVASCFDLSLYVPDPTPSSSGKREL